MEIMAANFTSNYFQYNILAGKKGKFSLKRPGRHIKNSYLSFINQNGKEYENINMYNSVTLLYSTN